MREEGGPSDKVPFKGLGWSCLLLWAGFAAWCVHGYPPAVDLPAHAAQIETLVEVLHGGPGAAFYGWHFPIGYGLTTWLGVPLALLFNGATAARGLLWLTLVLFPLSHSALARALGRSGWVAVLGAPCAFNLSYWFGFLPTLFAWPWVLFGWALFVHGLQREPSRRRALVGTAAIGVFVMLCHLVAFAAFAVGVAALALASRRRRPLLDAAGVLAPGFLLSASEVVALLGRAAQPGGRLPSRYDLPAHFRWTLWHYGWDQRTVAWMGILTAAAFVAVAWRRRRTGSALPASLALSMGLLYFVTPLAVSGAWLVHARFPVLIVLTALLLIDVRELPRLAQWSAVGGAFVALLAVAHFHETFADSISGLGALVSQPTPPGISGGLSLVGTALPHQRIRFLEHLPQWWTATQGGIGNHFFADADHQPVEFVPGKALPQLLTADHPKALRAFNALLVFGDGALPSSLSAFRVVAHAGHWRRLDRR